MIDVEDIMNVHRAQNLLEVGIDVEGIVTDKAQIKVTNSESHKIGGINSLRSN